MYNSAIIKLPIGYFEIVEEGEKLIRCSYSNKRKETVLSSILLKRVKSELDEYFLGERKVFDIPLGATAGTEFQKSVWKGLTKLRYGQKVSYKNLAQKLKRPGAYRAVGSANGKNPICIIVPCHRVVKQDGSLGGYSAGGEKTKDFLLELESRHQ